MNVVFDHQIFSVQRYGGFTKYFVSLAQALRGVGGVQAAIVAPAHVNEYLAGHGGAGFGTFALRHPARGLKYRPLATAPLFRLAAWSRRPDVVHETHYILHGGHVPAGAAVMATCHDMIIERFGDGSPANQAAVRNKRLALERASGIICISENTRADLLERYPHLEPRVSVVHHGVDHAVAPAGPPPQLPREYLLFVGVRSGYKNFEGLLGALAASGRLARDLALVCFGGGALTEAERGACHAAGLADDRVHQLAGSDELLASVYRGATALVYPSRYEGFGMPLTEAMVQGCPVVCSRASSFPEICADAAEYFDPADPQSICQAIESVVYDRDRRAGLVQRGQRRATAFTWQACAHATAAAYRRALDARPLQ